MTFYQGDVSRLAGRPADRRLRAGSVVRLKLKATAWWASSGWSRASAASAMSRSAPMAPCWVLIDADPGQLIRLARRGARSARQLGRAVRRALTRPGLAGIPGLFGRNAKRLHPGLVIGQLRLAHQVIRGRTALGPIWRWRWPRPGPGVEGVAADPHDRHQRGLFVIVQAGDEFRKLGRRAMAAPVPAMRPGVHAAVEFAGAMMTWAILSGLISSMASSGVLMQRRAAGGQGQLTAPEQPLDIRQLQFDPGRRPWLHWPDFGVRSISRKSVHFGRHRRPDRTEP